MTRKLINDDRNSFKRLKAGTLSKVKFDYFCFYSFSPSLKTMYMFYALALVCDDYFVPSLEKICEVRHLFCPS